MVPDKNHIVLNLICKMDVNFLLGFSIQLFELGFESNVGLVLIQPLKSPIVRKPSLPGPWKQPPLCEEDDRCKGLPCRSIQGNNL